MRPLPIIDAAIAERCSAIAEGRALPCRRGCDACCRQLASPLEISECELERVRVALDRLEAAVREQVIARVRALASEQRPYTCPFLERDRGDCLIYDARPLACRAFGFT